MFDHGVPTHHHTCITQETIVLHVSPGNVVLVPRHLEVVPPHSPVHVVVLPAPPPELVGEPVDEVELPDTDGRDSSEGVLVEKIVIVTANPHCHVARLGRTGVEVTIVLRQQVNIVEDCRARHKERAGEIETHQDSPSLKPSWPPCNQH